MAENLIFKDGPIMIDGNLTLKNKLVVHGDIILSSIGKVNGIDLSKDVLQFGKKYSGNIYFLFR